MGLEMKIAISITITCLIQELVANDSPILATKYWKKAAQGFATNYFKTLKFEKYDKENIKDISDEGFKNVRLRCRADLDGLNMTVFLNNLETYNLLDPP